METQEKAQDKAVALRRMKWFAAALLVAAGCLFALAKSQHDAGVWAWVSSFAEAAMVGALADWFAVVALFRHPLGVPIPHTAIVATRKERIGQILGNFVQNHFLSRDVIAANLRRVRPAERAARWLS